MCKHRKDEPFMGSKENMRVCHYDENDLDLCSVRFLLEGTCPEAPLSEMNKEE